MDDLYDYRNSLREINLTIGNDEKMFQPCSVSDSNSDIYVHVNINCLSWNASKSITRKI